MPAPPVPAAEAFRQRAQRARLRRWIMGTVFGVPLLLLAGAFYLLLGPKPPPPPSVLPVSATQAARAEQNLNAVRQALTDPQPTDAAAAPGPPGAATAVRHHRGADGKDVYTLQVAQADLNAYLASNKKLKQSLETKGIHAVSVELRAPANVVIHANATLKGVTDNALVAATLTPDPQTGLRLDISDARFGRLPPPVVRAAADRIAAQVVGRSKTALPLTVQKAEVKGTDLILTGVRRDAAPPKG